LCGFGGGLPTGRGHEDEGQVTIDKAALDDILRPLYFEAVKGGNPKCPKQQINRSRTDRSNECEQKTRFNGAELSESVLARDWNSPEEDATWLNL
jgi:hypothetical protein